MTTTNTNQDMQTKKNASACAARTKEEIEKEVKDNVRNFLNNTRRNQTFREEGSSYKCDWMIPPGLEEKMVAYQIETYGMSPAEICEHFGRDPFEDILDYLETESLFKIRAYDLYEKINPGLHFNLWFHIVKDIYRFEEDRDYKRLKHRPGSSVVGEFAFTVDAAIRITVDSDSIAGCMVSDACFTHGPSPTFGLLPGYEPPEDPEIVARAERELEAFLNL